MAEYIDREAQIDRLYRLHLTCEKVITEFLMTASTIDAEPVVRCKDCKHWSNVVKQTNEKDEVFARYCLPYNLMTTASFFCADGERKEDGDKLGTKTRAD